MIKRQEQLLEEYLKQINEQYYAMFKDLAFYCDSLGYRPVRNKTQMISIDFKNTTSGKSIMKMDTLEGRHDGFAYGERNRPGLRLKFFATKEYSKIFQNAVKRVIEDFDGKYTGCYGCGRCKGNPQGYVYVYPDGKTVFRCGSELLCIFDFENSIEEIKLLLKNQAEYYKQV